MVNYDWLEQKLLKSCWWWWWFIRPDPGDDIFGDDDYVEDATDVGDGDVEEDVDGDDNLAE